ncbi:MAG: sugar nucleotide-binding protein [Thermodesulfobacteriota bacterium]
MFPLLLTGATGGLGAYLWPELVRIGAMITGVSRSHGNAEGILRADLTSAEESAAVLRHVAPRVIVHAAAMTDVDGCQGNPQGAFLANVHATRLLVDWVRHESPETTVVLVSTDQVYGVIPGPHAETCPGPVNIYGWTKLWAEDLVRTLDRFLVLRINYVGRGTAQRPGLSQWIVSSLRAGRPITLFRDVLFNPLSGTQMAAAMAALISGGVEGVYNLGAMGEGVSKADFALRLAGRLGLPTSSARSGSLAEVALKAPRPHDTRMDVSRLASRLVLPDMEMVIASVAEELQTAERGSV